MAAPKMKILLVKMSVKYIYTQTRCVCEGTFRVIYFFKKCPEGNMCGNFLKKRQKMFFIEGRF